jgi:hypothetical protein
MLAALAAIFCEWRFHSKGESAIRAQACGY